MKKILSYFAIIALSLGFITSCDLDIYPSNILTEEQMKEAPTGLEDLVNGCYARFKSSSFIQQLHRMTDFGSDDVVYGHETEDAAINMAFRYEQRNSGLNNVRSHWSQCYGIIYAANVAIELADSMEQTPEVEYLKGEALFMKAMAYHELVRIFARPYSDNPDGLGIILRDNTEDVAPKARASVKETYTAILDLLDEAAPLLADRSVSSRSSDRCLASIGAVNALYSSFYLYMGEWDKCIEYSTKVINERRYYRLTSAANFKEYYRNCTSERESIWCIGYKTADEGNPGLTSMITAPKSGCWSEEGYSAPLLEDMGIGTDLEQDDARWGFVEEGFKKNGLTLIPCSKYDGPAANVKWISVPLFRLAEIYFNRAEAYAQKGQDDLALADINTVRTARMLNNAEDHLWTAADAANAGGMVELVLKEKRIDYPFEFQRWFDLGRHKKDVVRNYWGFHTPDYLGVTQPGVPGLDRPGVVVSYSDPHFIYPIPNTELVNNELCEKNPGY